MNSAVKSICDIMRRSNCAGAMQYVPELTWILFLRILDERETRRSGRWQTRWGSSLHPFPGAALPLARLGRARRPCKRQELAVQGSLGAFFNFVNGELLPALKGLKDARRTLRRARRSSARS